MTIEFSSPVSEGQRAFLAADKEKLAASKGGTQLWQHRVKKATEAYAEAKAIYTDVDFGGTPVDEDRTTGFAPGFPDWPTYRDNFLLDWIANRTVMSEEEADALFDREAEAALNTLDGEPTVDITPRPRPEGGLKPVIAAAAIKAKAKTVSNTKANKIVKAKIVKANVKKFVSNSDKAFVIITRYQGRGWTRKRIIEKLCAQLDMGAAYASTLYQKFAK